VAVGANYPLVKGEVKLSTVGGTSVRVRITMTNWESFYQKTKELPPSPLLVEAMFFTNPHGKAIDIGGGGLKDTRYLLE